MCAFLAAAVELSPDHPGQAWLAADSGLLSERLHRLARAAGASDPSGVADGLLAFYDAALARLARQAVVPGLDTGDLLLRARRVAAGWVAGELRPVRAPG